MCSEYFVTILLLPIQMRCILIFVWKIIESIYLYCTFFPYFIHLVLEILHRMPVMIHKKTIFKFCNNPWTTLHWCCPHIQRLWSIKRYRCLDLLKWFPSLCSYWLIREKSHEGWLILNVKCSCWVTILTIPRHLFTSFQKKGIFCPVSVIILEEFARLHWLDILLI